jgi:tripartite-type tricarboxylate transporter receptor subunit TctC
MSAPRVVSHLCLAELRGPGLRVIAARVACVAALLLLAGTALAQATYPAKPVHLVIGFSPGGGNDLIARLVGERLQEAWAQPVIIDNKPGADGIIAAEFVARAPADGYTLLVGATGQMTTLPALRTSLPYDTLRDFSPIAMIGSFPLVFVVNPAVAAKTVKDFVALARASPGKLNYAAGASAFELAVELFKLQSGIDIRQIPYKGGAPAINAVLAGDVEMTFVDSSPIIPHLQSGRLRALAVTSAERAAALPEVPTMIESGFRDYEVVLWTGLFAPAATPPQVLERLQHDLTSVLRSSPVSERFAALSVSPGGPSSAAFVAFVRRELSRWSTVARTSHLAPE